jgi:phosphoglycerate dehydrogenase-like enzyme
MKPKAIFLLNDAKWSSQIIPRVYTPETRRRLEGMLDLHPTCLHPADLARPEVAALCRDAEIILATWGMPPLSPEQIAGTFPKLKAVFYAAGTVQSFARPFLARNIVVVSAWAANAVPVSEFTLAQILLANKQTLNNMRRLQNGGPHLWRPAPPEGFEPPGNYDTTVALVSLGQIGQRVANLLKPFRLNIVAFEPYPRPGLAESLGVKLVSLEECFSTASVISLHAPNLPTTKKMIRREHFELMRPHTTFINTARGGPVDQDALLDVMEKRPDLTAVIDVTDPHEPPPAGSRYYSLPNVFLTSHIAGSAGHEVARMGVYVTDEVERHLKGQPLQYKVTEPMLETMA